MNQSKRFVTRSEREILFTFAKIPPFFSFAISKEWIKLLLNCLTLELFMFGIEFFFGGGGGGGFKGIS